MNRQPPTTTRTYTLFPYTPLCRSRSQRPPNAGFRNTSRSRTDMLVMNPEHPQALNEFCQNAAAVGRHHGHLGLEYFSHQSAYGSLRSADHFLLPHDACRRAHQLYADRVAPAHTVAAHIGKPMAAFCAMRRLHELRDRKGVV